MNRLRRRLLLGAAAAVPLLEGCRATLPAMAASSSTPAGLALMNESCEAHGAASFARLNDINVSYSGRWHRLVKRLQPELVNAPFRGGSEERLLPRERLIAQSHSGPAGHKQVVRMLANGAGNTQVWFNDRPSNNLVELQAAALVADGYSLFLLGPLWISTLVKAGYSCVVDVASPETVKDDRQSYLCDVLTLRSRPGLGVATEDQFALYIDRSTRVMRRVRFTLEGLEPTRGALVEVDTLGPIARDGIVWPTRFHERLLRPGPLKVHDWHLSGLDVNRGYGRQEITQKSFSGLALPPAAPLAATQI